MRRYHGFVPHFSSSLLFTLASYAADFTDRVVRVLDVITVIMGSWNWSNNAQKQDNSDVIITACPKVAQAFEAAYQRIIERDKPQ